MTALPRIFDLTNKVNRDEGWYGCVTLHGYHFSVEAGLPQTRVLLWVSGEQLRAVSENVVYRAKSARRRAPHRSSAQQLLLFEVVHAGQR
jgi:hypothetical protein